MAVTLVFSPLWFHGIDIALELFSVLAAVLISIMGYKAFKLTNDKKSLWLATAFGFITLSFLARAITAGVVLLQIGIVPGIVDATPSMTAIESVFDSGRFVYFALVFAAYLILYALSAKISDKKQLCLLSIFLGLFAFSAFEEIPIMFYLVSFVLLFFIASNYIRNYLAKKTRSTFLISVAFSVMALEPLFAMIAIYYKPIIVAAYFFRLLAYVILLVMLVRVYRK